MQSIVKKNILVLILLIIGSGLLELNARTQETDSLEDLLQQHIKKDIIRVNLLNETAYKFHLINKDKLLEYADEAGKLSDLLNFSKGKAESLRLTGLYYWSTADYDKALKYYQKSLKIFEEINDESGISNCNFNIGTYYKYNGHYPKALEYYQKSLKSRKELGNKKEISYTYNALGNIYSDLFNYPKALECYKKGLAIREKLNDRKLIAGSYNNIGVLYAHLGDYSKSFEYYQKGIEILEKQGDKITLALFYQNIGAVYEYQHDYSQAKEYYHKALKIYGDFDDKKRIAFCYIDIGVICRLQKNFLNALEYFNKSLKIDVEPGSKYAKASAYKELALLYFEHNKMKEAYSYSKNAYLLAEEIGNPELLKKSSEVLAKSCNAIGNYKDAYQYYVVFKTMNDSLFNTENIQKITSIEYQYKYEKEIGLLREKEHLANMELNNEKNIKYFLFIILIILIVFVVFIIINKRKLKAFYKNELRLSKEIKEIDDDYKEILEANSDVVFMVNIVGKQLYFNKQVEKLLGYKRDDLIGKLFTDFVPKSEMPKYLGKLEEVFLKKQILPFETLALHKDGRHIPVEIIGKIMKHKGKTVGVGTIRDITDRKKAEIEIRKLTLAVDQSSATIVITDTDGKIEYANPFFTKITGYTLEQAKGVNPRILKSGHTTDEEYKELWDTITSGKTWQGEFLNIKKNKEKYWEKVIISPVKNNNDKIINYVAVKEDITEKKKAEQALKESEAKLQESNKTKDKFFSIIAHDLKSPFNSLLGFSDLLLQNHKKYDEEKREYFIKSINNSSKNTYKLLENLLTWSHSQTGIIEFLPQEIKIKTVISEIVLLSQPIAKNKSIGLLDDTESNISVYADKNMINTVLRNLITNAIKFTKKNGTIIVSVNETKKQDFIEISVTDTGVGIPKDKIDNLFRIDKNTSTPGTEKEIGTGLGLILCKEFVEKNSGEIWAESEVDKGSKFIFTLPVIKNI